MWITIFLCSDLKGSVDTIHFELSLTTHMARSIYPKFSLEAIVFTSVLPILSKTFSNSMSIITKFTTNTFLAYNFTILFRLLLSCAAVQVGIYLAANILIFLNKVIKNVKPFTKITSAVNVKNLWRM